MDTKTWMIAGALALVILGSATFVSAGDEGWSLERVVSTLHEMNETIGRLAFNVKEQGSQLTTIEDRMNRENERLGGALAWMEYMDNRLTGWMYQDKTDIANLYDITASQAPTTETKMGHLEDTKDGYARGWMPNDEYAVFTIWEPNVKAQSVITLTVDQGDTQCHVRAILVEKGQRHGFAIACDGPVSEGANLNYHLMTPLDEE